MAVDGRDPAVNAAAERDDPVQNDLLIVALLEGRTMSGAAEAAGYSERHARRIRRENPEFRARLESERRERFELSVARLAAAPDIAITTLIRVAADDKAQSPARVNAADRLLRWALEFGVGQDVVARVGKLEELVERVLGRVAA